MPSSYAVTAYAVWKTLAISVPTVFEALIGRMTVQRGDARLAQWSRGIIEKAQIAVDVRGLEKVPRDRAYILMSNHQSHFDIPILYFAWPATLRMVAKAELFKVPVWGRAMRATGFVAVDRSGDRAKAEKAMQEAGEALRRNISIWIAPEGTRSPDGKLGKLKKGGFILARATGVPIVPVAIDGSRNILPKHATVVQTGVPVRVTLGTPIPTENRPIEDLMSAVQSFFTAHLSQ